MVGAERENENWDNGRYDGRWELGAWHGSMAHGFTRRRIEWPDQDKAGPRPRPGPGPGPGARRNLPVQQWRRWEGKALVQVQVAGANADANAGAGAVAVLGRLVIFKIPRLQPAGLQSALIFCIDHEISSTRTDARSNTPDMLPVPWIRSVIRPSPTLILVPHDCSCTTLNVCATACTYSASSSLSFVVFGR